MEFKVGQKWRSRDGKKVFTIVLIADQATYYPIKAVAEGAVQGRDYQVYTHSYAPDGKWRGNNKESGIDLVELIEDAWVEWVGGENPVPGAFVSYQLRNGGSHEWWADLLSWGHGGSGSDILRYRVVRPAPAPAAKPEPEPKPFSIDAPGDYVTRDGRKARVLCVDRKHDTYTVAGLVPIGDVEYSQTWRPDGGVGRDSNNPLNIVGKWGPFANLPIDAQVWVRNFPTEGWKRRHFAGVVDGKPQVWMSGCTSHTTESNTRTLSFAYIVTTKPEDA